jgi:N-acetylglucosaminyldiphosphoundecaprenol N-acetyl-beta-D-mannosaminyltransferase
MQVDQPIRHGVPVDHVRGLPVTTLPSDAVIATFAAWIAAGSNCRYFACVNAHSAEVANRDPEFMEAMQQAAVLVADGAGVTLASRIVGGRIRHRTTGPAVFTRLSKLLDAQGGRSVFYLGASTETLDRIAARHAVDFPGLRIAGLHAPPYQPRFTDDEIASVCRLINAARPDVVWVGLGAPKQEKWSRVASQFLEAPLIAPIGAMFAFYAGEQRMPPEWVLAAGFGWLHRLAQDPRRLWARNLDTPRFLVNVIIDRLRRRGGTSP